MTTTIFNTRGIQQITDDLIQSNITKAQRSFFSSKDSAAEAGAHTYIVWLDTLSPFADPKATAWLEQQIDDRNEKIDEHNNKEKADKQRAREFRDGTLNKDDLVNTKPTNDADRKDIAEECAMLKRLDALTKKEWAARRKVRVKAQKDADRFTRIVKFVFSFDLPAHASVTARYAKVLEWIDAKFNGVTIEDASEIVTAIKEAGGFEMVINKQRGNHPAGNEEADEIKIIEEAIAGHAKVAVQAAAAIASFDMQINDAPEGIVRLIGRYVDGKVDVVGDIPLEDGEVDSFVARFNVGSESPTNANSEFVARVLALGDIVAEGKATKQTLDGTVAGQKLKEQRTFSLQPDDKGNTGLVISALHAESSAVIKALPDTSRVSLGKASIPMVMSWESYHALKHMLSDPANRRLIEIVADVEPVAVDGKPTQSRMSWSASNSALTAKKHPNGCRTFTWQDMAQLEAKPLDVEHFNSQFFVSVSAADIEKLYQERLKIWQGKMGSKKIPKLITLSFRGAAMTYKVEGDQDLKISCVGTIDEPVVLQFRPLDLHDLVLKLTQQNTPTFNVSGDEGGLLCVSWSDALGAYSVYMPTGTTDGRQEYRRVERMRVSPSTAQLAA